MKKTFLFVSLLLISVSLFACNSKNISDNGQVGLSNKTGEDIARVDTPKEDAPKTQIANPASQYCIDNGGKLEIRNNKGSVGYCLFDDGSECEEWQYYRKECKKGDSIQKKEEPKIKEYKVKTVPHKQSVGEDIFVSLDGKDVMSIVSDEDPTFYYKLTDHFLFVDKGTSALKREFMVYDLSDKSKIFETAYKAGSLLVVDSLHIVEYETVSFEQPEGSKTKCREQEGYFQRMQYDYINKKTKELGEIYCGYIE